MREAELEAAEAMARAFENIPTQKITEPQNVTEQQQVDSSVSEIVVVAKPTSQGSQVITGVDGTQYTIGSLLPGTGTSQALVGSIVSDNNSPALVTVRGQAQSAPQQITVQVCYKRLMFSFVSVVFNSFRLFL